MKNQFHSVLVLLITILVNSFLHAQEIKVEPAFWWIGMNNPELQLLVYAENIAESEVEIKYKGIELVKVNKVENPNYLFIDLKIQPDAKPGKFNIEFLKKNGKNDIVFYELKKRKKISEDYKGFDNSDVIYLIMPDRFSNGNPENDSHPDMLEKADRNNPDGRHGGDLQGIINHLDYISNLGVTAAWLTPFQENNRPKYSYHGYAISDFYKTDPRIGTNKDYVKFVEECHKRDLKVIMDVVLNHCDTTHWFIRDLPSQDWIHQFPEFTRSNFRTPVQLDPYASDFDKEKMLNGWFDRFMADLNHDNPFLLKYLIQNTIWWIESAGLNGIRLDTQPYSEKEHVATWAKSIFEEYPDFNIVGEAWLQKIAITAYWQKDANNVDGYNSNIPSVTDFPMHSAISQAFNENEGWAEGMARLYYILAQDFLYANPEMNLIFPDNHDLSRFYQNMQKDIRKYKMGLSFILTTRGIPMIYYGTEILMVGKEHAGHGYIRRDFPGGWPNDTINAFIPDGRTVIQNEAFDFLKNLLNWRKEKEVIQTGKLKQFVPENGIYVYFRYNENETVMIVLNNNDEERSFETGRYNEVIKDYSKGYEIISKSELNDISNISISAKSAMIIELYNK